MDGMLELLNLLCWAMPSSRVKNLLLNRLGHDVARTARIGPALVRRVTRVHVGEHVHVAAFNVVRGLSRVWLDDYAIVGSWNWISAHPAFQREDPDAGTLFLGVRAKIGSRNYLDCSGTVTIRSFGSVGGQRCMLLTHQTDLAFNRQGVGRITVGDHALVASCAVMLKGTRLPDRSVLAANSTLTGSVPAEKRGLYAGSPAAWRHPVSGNWFADTDYWIDEHVVDEPMGILDDDLSNSTSYRDRVVRSASRARRR